MLVALVTTGLRRAELIGLDWQQLVLDGPQPSALVRDKGDRPRRQPLAPALAEELRELCEQLEPGAADPVFCGLRGGRLSPKILASIVKRAAERAGIEMRVTAHTLRHTAATWLRQQTRRCAPRRGVPRARGLVDGRSLRARGAGGVARGGGRTVAHRCPLLLTRIVQ